MGFVVEISQGNFPWEISRVYEQENSPTSAIQKVLLWFLVIDLFSLIFDEELAEAIITQIFFNYTIYPRVAHKTAI